jgi:hypothetical protein
MIFGQIIELKKMVNSNICALISYKSLKCTFHEITIMGCLSFIKSRLEVLFDKTGFILQFPCIVWVKKKEYYAIRWVNWLTLNSMHLWVNVKMQLSEVNMLFTNIYR